MDSDDIVAAERRLLRSRDGRREPSALRLAALRDGAHARWRSELGRKQRRRHGAARAMGAGLVVAAALLVAVVPGFGGSGGTQSASCAPAEYAAYCPPARDGDPESADEREACQLYSPPPTICV
jgi:hypothetical protein